MSLQKAHGAITAQHRAEGTSPLAPGPWARKGRGGRKRTCVQNHKIAGLGAERLEVEYMGPGSGQCPGSGGQAPTWSPGMAGLKKPVLTQSGQAACQGLQGAILWGRCHQLSWIWV